MEKVVIYEDANYLIEYFTGEKSTKLVHTFTHLGNRELAGMGYGGAEFFDAGYDVIA